MPFQSIASRILKCDCPGVLVGGRIRFLRKKRGWTMLAEHSGLSREHLSELENGPKEIGLRALAKIAMALNVEMDVFGALPTERISGIQPKGITAASSALCRACLANTAQGSIDSWLKLWAQAHQSCAGDEYSSADGIAISECRSEQPAARPEWGLPGTGSRSGG